MRDLDERQRAARELGGDPPDDLLVRVVRRGKVERALAQLENEDDHEPDEKARQREHEQARGTGDIHDDEAARHQVHPHRGQQHHGLVGHHEDQLPFRADEAVRGACLVGAQDEEDARQREGEYREKQVAAGEEQDRGEDHEDEEEIHVEVLRSPHDDGFLAEQLCHVVEGLQEGRAPASLHARGELAVDPGKKPSRKRRRQDRCHGKEGRLQRAHSDTPNITKMRAAQAIPPKRDSLCSPKRRGR